KRRERCAPIPKGLCPPAQGCEERAILGHRPQNVFNRNAVVAIPFSPTVRGFCHKPVGVAENLIPFTQGSSCVATLGYMTESLWDSLSKFRRIPRTVPDGENFNFAVFGVDGEVNRVRPRFGH